MRVFAGIDPSSRSSIPTACAALAESGEVLDVSWCDANGQILRWLSGIRKLVAVGVDGPLRLPLGLEAERFFGSADEGIRRARRKAEMELARLGIGCFFTSPRAFAQQWVIRCLKLGEELRAAGLRVLEVYPYATRCLLRGTRRLQPKTKPAARWEEVDWLISLGIRWRFEDLPSHHEIDAVLCALTVFLHWKGMAKTLGEPLDGEIIVPTPGLRWSELLPELWKTGGRER